MSTWGINYEAMDLPTEPRPLNKEVTIEILPEEGGRPAEHYSFINKSHRAEVFTENESKLAILLFVAVFGAGGAFLGIGAEEGNLNSIMIGVGLMIMTFTSVGLYLHALNKAQDRQDKLLGQAAIKELAYPRLELPKEDSDDVVAGEESTLNKLES